MAGVWIEPGVYTTEPPSRNTPAARAHDLGYFTADDLWHPNCLYAR